MPSSCSAPGCTSNYDQDDRVPIFRMPDKPPELRQAWISALHRDDIDTLKVVNVCAKHFRDDDIIKTHKVPNGDGTFTDVPRTKPKLRDGAIPCFLPGCPFYYSSTSTTKRTRLSFESKEEEFINQTIQLSLLSDSEEKKKYMITNLRDLKDKLFLINLQNNWLVWYRDDTTITFIHPNMVERSISVNLYLEINSSLVASAWLQGQSFSLSMYTINDVRQIEYLLNKIYLKYAASIQAKSKHTFHELKITLRRLLMILQIRKDQ